MPPKSRHGTLKNS